MVSPPRVPRRWYYDALVEGDTHVVVDHDSLYDTVKDLEKHPGRAEALVAAARRVDEALLCPRCIATYFLRALEHVRDRWAMRHVLDDPCALLAFFDDPQTRADVGCDDLKLVEVVSLSDKRTQSNAHSWRHTGSNWEDPKHHQEHWGSHNFDKEDDKRYGQMTHSLVDGKPFGAAPARSRPLSTGPQTCAPLATLFPPIYRRRLRRHHPPRARPVQGRPGPPRRHRARQECHHVLPKARAGSLVVGCPGP